MPYLGWEPPLQFPRLLGQSPLYSTEYNLSLFLSVNRTLLSPISNLDGVNGHLKIRTFSKLGGKSAPLATVPVTTRIMSNASERDNMRNQARSMADLEKMTIYYFAFIGYG
jgi:hypothetical protein